MMIGAGLITGLALAGISRLGIDEQPRRFLRADDPRSEFLNQLYADFGSDDSDVIVVLQSSDVFQPAVARAIRNITSRAAGVDGVGDIYSLADVVVYENGPLPRIILPPPGAPPEVFAEARRLALQQPLIVNQLLSPDATTTLMVVRLRAELAEVPAMKPVIESVRDIVREVSASESVSASLTGIPTIRVELFELLKQETGKFNIIGAVLGAAVAYLLFRRAAAVAVVAAGPIVGSLWTLGLMGWIGQEINVMNAVVPTLVLVIGFTDAVHLMHDIRRSRRQGLTAREASREAVRHLGPACALTSLTTAVGFGSLAVADLGIIRAFGLTCAAGTVITLLAVVVLVPLLSASRLGAHIVSIAPNGARRRRQPAGAGLIRFVTRHSRAVSVAGVGLTAAMAASALALRPDSRLTEGIPDRSESTLALRICDEAFGGMMLGFIVVDWTENAELEDVLAVVEEVEALVEAEPLTSGALSIRGLLAALPSASAEPARRMQQLAALPQKIVGRFVHLQKRRTLVSFHLPDLGTSVYEPVVADFERQLAALQQRYPEVTLTLTGTPILAVLYINGMIADLGHSLLLAAVIIFAVMTVALRRLRLGLIAVIPNIFPLAFTAAALVCTGRHLQLTSVTVFTICLGIAVDDTIHFLLRFRRELSAGREVEAAIENTFEAVGAALVTTTLVLGAGWFSLLLSHMPIFRLFGGLACLAMAGALIGDLLILPALLAWLNRTRSAA